MFVLQDMVIELMAGAAVLVVVVLCAHVLAAAVHDRVDQRSARRARARMRQRVWHDYAAACAPASAPAPAGRGIAPLRPATSARTACDQSVSLSAGPVKA